MWHAGAPADEIAVRFGVSRGTVSKWAAKHKLPPRGRCYRPPAKDPTPAEIAERMAYCRAMREAGTPIGGV